MKIADRQITSLNTDSCICAAIGGICVALAGVLQNAWSFACLLAGMINLMSARRLRQQIRENRLL
jgi:hypothetical protein